MVGKLRNSKEVSSSKIRDHELTADLDPESFENHLMHYLSRAHALANGMPVGKDQWYLFTGFFSGALIDPPNIPYGRDFEDNDLSPTDTIKIRQAIYEYFGAEPVDASMLDWKSVFEGEDRGIARTEVVWPEPVYIEEVWNRRSDFYEHVTPETPDYQFFGIRIVNPKAHKFIDQTSLQPQMI